MRKVIKKDGSEVKPGEVLIDFRGETARFQSVSASRNRVYVKTEDGYESEYFPSVYDLTIVDED